MAPIKSESDWVAYKEIVMSSKIRLLDVIFRTEFAHMEVPRIALEIRNDPSSDYEVPQQEVNVSQEDIVGTQDTEFGECGGHEDRGTLDGHIEVLVPSNCDYEGRDTYDDNMDGRDGNDQGIGVATASNRVQVEVEGDDETYEDDRASDSGAKAK